MCHQTVSQGCARVHLIHAACAVRNVDGMCCRRWVAAKDTDRLEPSIYLVDRNHSLATQGGAVYVCCLPLGMPTTAANLKSQHQLLDHNESMCPVMHARPSATSEFVTASSRRLPAKPQLQQALYVIALLLTMHQSWWDGWLLYATASTTLIPITAAAAASSAITAFACGFGY